MVYGRDVVAVDADGDLRVVELADGTTLVTRTVVVATVVAHRTLDAPSLEAFNGVGVHYGSAISPSSARRSASKSAATGSSTSALEQADRQARAADNGRSR